MKNCQIFMNQKNVEYILIDRDNIAILTGKKETNIFVFIVF